ncbi:MAG: sigma-70 family RNA polymerase sigma factor [Bacteroidia bacterium]|nr:sigma-70 family RNA polymerase sigma factor [Bacteroidia bacterium]
MRPIRKTLTPDELRSEHRLVEAAQQNPRHFSALYERYYDAVYLFIYKRLHEEEIAGDLTADVFIKALHHLPKYRFQGVPFSAWLFRIASNEVNQYFRHNQRQRHVSLERIQLGHLIEEIEEQVSEDSIRQVLDLIQTLPPDDLQLIELRFFEQLSYKEIGLICHMTENNAKVRVYRLLTRLRTTLEKQAPVRNV